MSLTCQGAKMPKLLPAVVLWYTSNAGGRRQGGCIPGAGLQMLSADTPQLVCDSEPAASEAERLGL